MIDIFYNGKFAGEVEAENVNSFVESLKERRRIGEFPVEMSFRFDEDKEAVFITTETGRVLRPLIVVKNGRSLCTQEHLKQVADGKLSWNDIVKQGVIEYIDAAEEENSGPTASDGFRFIRACEDDGEDGPSLRGLPDPDHLRAG